jgi:RNA polymerase sigma-70 factor (ECF subfamily)
MTERSPTFVPSSTSTSLVEGLRNREPDAWRRLVRLYGPLVHHWAQQCGLQDCDAADVMQEAMQAVSGGIAQFDHARSDSTFRGWLWVITRNEIRDFLSRRNAEPRPTGGTDAHRQLHALPEEPPETTQAESRLSHRALKQIQGEFAPHVWTAFWRSTVEQDAVRDVAEDLGLSIWAVYKARARVLERLRDELGEPDRLNSLGN